MKKILSFAIVIAMVMSLFSFFGAFAAGNSASAVVVPSIEKSLPDVVYQAPSQSAAVNAQIVAPVDDKLVYNAYTDKGDKIGDYSYGGFYAGDYELPISANLPVAATIEPSSDPETDDTARIQEAIDKVYNESADDNMKIIRLKAGIYNISQKGIKLRSGIVLQGEGQSADGTVLFAKDLVQYAVLNVAGSKPQQVGENAFITDSYVPAGATKLNIDSSRIGDYKVGDLITICHPSTVKWADAIGMYGIINVYDNDTSWKDNDVTNYSERTITAINGTEITIDFPVYVPLMKELAESYIYKTNDDGRVKNVGIENLRIVSNYNGDPNDESHATIAIKVTNAKDCYVRDVTAKHFYASLISSGDYAKRISVVNCSNLEPVSKVAGSRRYSFAVSTSAQQILYTGCYSHAGRHDFETSFAVTGPIAFVDNTVDDSSTASETHGTWSTGILYDNLYQISNNTKGFLAFANRGIYGTATSQGWAAASTVAWNCLSSTIIGHKPPLTYQNFMVGAWGIYNDDDALAMKEKNITSYKKIYRTAPKVEPTAENFATQNGTSMVGDCYKEAEFTPVEPRSLFKAQLAERYTSTIRNARPNAPIIVNPKYDKVTKDNEVTVSGLYQLGATKVTVYIDNQPYDAALNQKDNTYSVKSMLNEGTHKIYATQTINGIEGTKTADRFITVGKSTGNHDYLQSIYTPDKTRMLTNDTRVTYDEYEKTVTEANKDKITILVDNKVLISDVEPYETNGRVLVPMRAIFEELNADVSWDEATATATATSYNKTRNVKITENQTTAYLNGQAVTLDVPATITNGRFMVPVRFISESMGAVVDWLDAKRTVVVTGIYVSDNPNHVPAKNAEWSHASGEGKTGAQAIDGDAATRWAGNEKGVWMKAEFDTPAKITAFQTMFGSQATRTFNFEIYFSMDGESYTKAFEGSSTLGEKPDYYTLPAPVEAKYFKFVGQGGSYTDWILLHEIEFYKE